MASSPPGTPAPAPAPAPHRFSAAEVAWMFVRKYYRTMHSASEMLHLFYMDNSTMLHGTEGQGAEQYNGREEIHRKFIELRHEDCRVCITNVDCLPSLDGGIFVQVIGEMSNRGEHSRKFAQSFFLAEQENGYYLLNDVFRYLKEALDEDYENDGEDEAVDEDYDRESQMMENGVGATPVAEASQLPQPEDKASSSVVEEEFPTSWPSEDKEPSILEDVETDPQLQNPESCEAVPEWKGPEYDSAADIAEIPPEEPTATTDGSESATRSTQHAADNDEPSGSSDKDASAPTAVEDFSPAERVLQESDSSPSLPAPTAPSTWASVVTHDVSKWSKETLADVKGTSVTPVPPPPRPAYSPHPHSAGHAKNSHPGLSHPSHINQNYRDAKKSRSNEPNASIFVRNVPGDITPELLSNAFATFGEVMNCDVNVARSSAFVDFVAVESACRAVKQREVELADGTIVVAEEKRAKQNRPPGVRGGYSGGRAAYLSSSRGRGRGIDTIAKAGRGGSQFGAGGK